VKKLIGAGLAALALGLSATVLAPTASAAVINQDSVAQFIATVNYESDRYGTGPVRVYVADLGDDTVIAQTQYGAITVNASYAALSPEEFNASMSGDFASGYEPGGCGGIQAVAIHEFGHVIDQRNGAVTSRIVAQAVNAGQVGNDLHGYAFEGGRINPGEAVAVSFQAVECGSATPTERSIYNLLVS
jgi:hypothetical protein